MIAIVDRVTLTLTVDSAAWNRRIDAMAARIDGLVPVVKGNGYGFGRTWLAERASLLAPTMAVGTVFEVDSVPSNYPTLVLTPTLSVPPDLRANAVLTIGSRAHLDAIGPDPRPRRVLIKIRSRMNRYGVDVAEVADLVEQCNRRRLEIAGLSIHPPLEGSFADHRREIEALTSRADPQFPVFVSHLDESEYAILRGDHPERTWYLRLGTSLWHGDKNEMSLTTDVLDVRTVTKATVAGYRSHPVATGQRIVILGCGSAHGVTPLSDGRSPFHFSRHRLALVEAPHMHTSMCIVPDDQPCPSVGDSVDVQRPLTMSTVDVVRWT